jgi:hypothetical protein
LEIPSKFHELMMRVMKLHMNMMMFHLNLNLNLKVFLL